MEYIELRPYPLNSDGFSFIRRELYYAERSLCRHLQNLPIEKGRTITYLPPDVKASRIHQFDLYFGAEFPPPKRYYERYSPEKEALLSALVENHLSAYRQSYAVGCHNMGKRNDPWIAKEQHPIFYFNDELYFFRHQNDGYEETSSRPSFHVGAYPGISALTSLDQADFSIENRTEISSSAMVSLAMRSRYVLLSAYDDTGYVYWCAPEEPYPHEIQV